MITASSPLWRKLQHPLVRDLAWCLMSPELMAPGTGCDTFNTGQQDAIQARLLELESNPPPLEHWMEQCHSRRLGLIFEHLWQFWWRHCSADSGEWLFNMQLHQHGRTLGEADALCWQGEELLHTELAVKFYLGFEAGDGTAAGWYGPEVKDRLDLKWHHLMERQLAPARLDSAPLPAHWHFRRVRSALLSRGRLFYPMLQEHFQAPDPALLMPHHDRGFWLRCSELQQLPEGHWQPLQRRQWLAPLRSSASGLLDKQQLIRVLQPQLTPDARPLQLARMQPENSEYFEVSRYFVVPDNWPTVSGAEFRKPAS
ncbi:DUF1853 family protein [Pseudomaricurvus sp. HS19]|uniref:DUF1853 family protein n=1 Tax=Pseudomaricurvus sp. HS19 TaxID=2692626 RepID=UPI001370C4F1|nr:DUF1853 family protein [Pseudomaricurvus sp. HS19]MYM62464.1 DUF1853 family protein [Pseudomaricurvus sp. HS19]